MINGTFKTGKGFDLTEEETKAVAVADKYLNQFLEADKVVFGFIMELNDSSSVTHILII